MNLTSKRTANYELNNTTLRVTYGNMVHFTADALVSSDDSYLTMGGGLSLALADAGGEVIRKETRKHVPVKAGDVAVTSAGQLSAKYIFHTVTLDYENFEYASEEIIQSATLKCLQLADTLGVRLIVFPALGTGVARLPIEVAAEVMTNTIADYLMGETQIELVTITLFPRLGLVEESDLDLFFERSVSLASISTQSKRIEALLAELEKIVSGMGMPLLSKRVSDLHIELKQAQNILAEKPESLERLEQIQDLSRMAEISQKVITVSSEAQDGLSWTDTQLEAQILRTKLNGLLAQLNIQTSHLNRFQIEKAKYGGVGVPPRLETSIEDMEQEISETEARVKGVRTQLAVLMSV